MKLTFIGTSHGVPEPDRRCTCMMLETAGRYYFIDMGTQAIEDLRHRGIAIEDVKGIFITHCHGDHTNGLISFVDLVNWYFKEADPTILIPERESIDALTAWVESNGTKMRDIKMDVVKEGVTYEDGFLKVTAIRTQHCRTSYAYFVEAEGKELLFTGDLKHPSIDFPAIAYTGIPFDLIVCEQAHFPSTDSKVEFDKTKAKRVIINHSSPRWNNQLHQMLNSPHDYKFGAAHDGLEIVL